MRNVKILLSNFIYLYEKQNDTVVKRRKTEREGQAEKVRLGP